MKEDYIEISDFSLVSVLVGCFGFPIVKMKEDSNDYSKVIFFFLKTKELEQTIAGFWEGSLRVEPKSYWSAIREIKSRIRMK